MLIEGVGGGGEKEEGRRDHGKDLPPGSPLPCVHPQKIGGIRERGSGEKVVGLGFSLWSDLQGRRKKKRSPMPI
jgi:hypothetical protein